MKFTNFQFDAPGFIRVRDKVGKQLANPKNPAADLKRILSCIDLTTLEGSDNKASVSALCGKAIRLIDPAGGIPAVAAVCVYPSLVKTVREQLRGTDIKTASVAGAFPSGQTSLQVKLEEVRYAANEGADEIDIVISRGKLLAGEYHEVFDELAAMREISSGLILKVILETGELQSPEMIRKASEIAIKAGADFIKTSTGKISTGATPEAFFTMLRTIRDFLTAEGKTVGIKASGGVRTPEQALQYYFLTREILGEEVLQKEYFRIGASSLLENIVKML